MTVSPRLRHYGVAAALLLAAGVAARRPEAFALAAPLGVLLATGLALARPGRLSVAARLRQARLLVDQATELEVEVYAGGAAEVELLVDLPEGLRAVSPAARLAGSGSRTAQIAVEAATWGVHRIERVRAVAHDTFGLFTWSAAAESEITLRIYPRPGQMRRLLRPLATQLASGATPAAVRGDGIEFADLREFQPGDVVRRVNWRASARRSNLIVNLQHPERSADVVLFVDSYADLRGAGRSSLALAVEAAAAIAAAHLKRRDRVGLIGFGGVLRWLRPGSGPVQSYRLLDALIDTQVRLSHAWRGLEHVPPRTLPPGAQVIALSPLADDRSVAALINLARRGRDLSIIEVPARLFQPVGGGPADELAGRIFELRQEALRGRFRQLGVAVASWDPDLPAEAALADLDEFRRRARRRRPA